MPHTIQSLLTQDRAALESALSLDSGTARIEVQMLLQQVLGVNRAYLLAHPERQLDEMQQAAYRALLQRRLAGEPLAYILGEREFFGLNFKVTPATLIPRPDTELLVELALQRIPQSGRVLDLGTGSGAIALSIARSRPDVDVTAVDASPEALEVAQENARRLGVGNARFVHSDWFAALEGERYDLIVSNPPYIEDADAHLGQGDLRFEPRSALASGTDGLDDIRRIVADAKGHLNDGGWLMFEHGYDQAERARELLEASGFADVFSARDLSGIERVSGGRYAGASTQAIR
ncbi:MAG TPA: peptide chain release factor N(5)-glutamine methyltransferase [Gallionella sp.]|nr:peptide chain release factor N(5)-glutamine methyltransferase [Gallionella sp.]